MILLIYPPVAKPCEPPAGIARLSGLLRRNSIPHRLLDANVAGMHHLLGAPLPEGRQETTWARRAAKGRERNLAALRHQALYRSPDRYRRAVKDLGKVLANHGNGGVSIGLADYADPSLSPLRSLDLAYAAEQHEANPFYDYFQRRLRDIFSEREPAYIGISVNYLSQALCAFAMTGFIRRELPKARIVLGGGLVTSWMSRMGWSNPFTGLVDHLISGPGEEALLSLLGCGASDGPLPRPDYKDLPADAYLSPGLVLPYSASVGCSWKRCTFCPEKAEDNRYRPIPPGQVTADLKALRDEANPALLHLLDNAVSPHVLAALCDEASGTPWYGFARIDRQLTDLSFCHALRRSGCVMLKLGVESGDQSVLDRLNKGVRLETASVVLRNLRAAGIASYVYLLFGTPAEDEASANRTLAFTAGHSDCIDYLNLAVFNMPACGADAGDLETRGFSDGDLSLYTDFIHPAGWDRRSVRLFLDRVFRRHPSVLPILRKEVPVFTSNHAPFFVMMKQPDR